MSSYMKKKTPPSRRGSDEPAAPPPTGPAPRSPRLTAPPQLDTGWRQAALQAGAVEHYEDAVLYDHEYKRRRDDVMWYRGLARQVASEQRSAARPLRVLELGCGSGRLLVPLLRDGCQVVGVDRSAAMLARCAERIARRARVSRERGQLVRADFRALPLADGAAERFPLIVCPFNGFMHLYTRRDVEQCLAEVRRLLAPDGLFAFDVLNPDPGWLVRDPLRRWSRTRFRHPGTGERLVYTTNHVYDAAAQIAWIRIYYEPDPAPGPAPDSALGAPRPSPPRTVQLTHRQFYPAELEALLHYNGFAIVQSAGGFDGQPISSVSAEQVICARVR